MVFVFFLFLLFQTQFSCNSTNSQKIQDFAESQNISSPSSGDSDATEKLELRDDISEIVDNLGIKLPKSCSRSKKSSSSVTNSTNTNNNNITSSNTSSGSDNARGDRSGVGVGNSRHSLRRERDV